MSNKNEIIWGLMDVLLKSKQGNAGQAGGYAPAVAGKSSPAPRRYYPASGDSAFDWQEEERVAYEPAGFDPDGEWVDEDAEMSGYPWEEEEYPMDQNYGWQGESGKGRCPVDKHPNHCKPKEKKCFCQPWPYKEKWICTKESRICCEPILCDKKKPPCHKNPCPCHKDPCHKDPCHWGGGLR